MLLNACFFTCTFHHNWDIYILIMKNILIALLFTSFCFAQTPKYTISGYVSEKGSREHLPGVTIYQVNTNNVTTSNVYGFYSITLPATDTLKLNFVLSGYGNFSAVMKLDKNISLNMQLAPVQLDEVEVVVNRTESVSEDVQ